jgi:hypothetical protein
MPFIVMVGSLFMVGSLLVAHIAVVLVAHIAVVLVAHIAVVLVAHIAVVLVAHIVGGVPFIAGTGYAASLCRRHGGAETHRTNNHEHDQEPSGRDAPRER